MSLIKDIREVMEKQEYDKQSVHYTYTTTKPEQYQIGIDTFTRMEANCTLTERLAFAKGNIDKYNWREKNQDIQDFEKIVSYANWAIKQLKNQEEINRLNP